MSRQRKKKKHKGVKPTKAKPIKKEEKEAPSDVEKQKIEEPPVEAGEELKEAVIAEAQNAKEAAEVEVVEPEKVTPTVELAHVGQEDQSAAAKEDLVEKPFYKKYSGEILLAILAIYVILLGFATVSELFELGWFKFDWLIGR